MYSKASGYSVHTDTTGVAVAGPEMGEDWGRRSKHGVGKKKSTYFVTMYRILEGKANRA